MQIAVPLDLAAKAADGSLRARLNEQPQAGLDRCPLRPCHSAAHGLAHQAIIDLNVRSHLNDTP
jgi:hypothetical protein